MDHVIAVALHVVAAIIWVGGMFFAYVMVRPAMGGLTPPDPVKMWGNRPGPVGGLVHWSRTGTGKPPEGFNRHSYSTGNNVLFEWHYSSPSGLADRTGAGFQPAGVVTGDAATA